MIKQHADGGTYEVIAFAETRNRWGIAITRWTTYRDAVVFEVCRVSDDGKMMRLECKPTEVEARQAANSAWRKDR